ncbi:MAG: FMN-binding negative transcriptional regulator, partial [Actinomycetota bacterium]
HAVPAGSTSADSEPWQVSDAPEDFIAGQLKAIVGVQLSVTDVIGKRKLSQNRSEPDRRGAQDGLEHSPRAGDVATADRMSTGA